MKAIFSLAVKALKKDWRQALKLTGAYALCACLLIAECLTVYSYALSAKEERLNTYGEQSGFLAGCTPQSIAALRQEPGVLKVGVINRVAQYTVPKAVYNNQLTIGAMDADAMALCHVRLQNGRMPQNSKEIVLERSAFAKLRRTATLGQTVTMELAPMDGSLSQTHTFTVVGILHDFSQLQVPPNAPQVELPGAFISESAGLSFPDGNQQAVSVIKFADETNVQEKLDALVSKKLGSACSVNVQISGQTGQQAPIRMDTLGAAVLISTAIFSVLLLLCFSVITRKDRKKRVGLLKITGFTNRDILHYFSIQSAFQLLIGLILGAGAGVLLSRVMLKSLGNFVHFFWNPLILPLCALLIFLAAFLILFSSVCKEVKGTVLSALQDYDKNDLAKNSTSFTSKKPLLLWAGKSILLNKSEAVSSSIAALFAMLVIVVGGFLSNGIALQADSMVPADLEVMVYDGGFQGELQIPNDPSYGMSDEDYERFSKSSEIGKITAVRRMSVNLLTSKGQTPTKNEDGTQAQQPPKTEAFENEKKKWGYGEDQELTQGALCGTDAETLLQLKKHLAEGKIDITALSSGTELIYCKMKADPMFHHAGDTLTLTQMVDDGTGNKQRRDFTMKIGAVVELGESRTPHSLEELALAGRLLIHSSAFEKLGLTVRTNELFLNYKNPEQTDEIEALVKELEYNYKGHVIVVTNLQRAQQERETARAFSLVTLALTSALTLFAVISLVISTSLKLRQRRGILGVLRAVGVTRRDVYLVTLMETLFQTGIAVLLGLLFSLGICVLITTQMNEFTLSSLPWTSIVAAPLLLLGFAALACLWPVQSLYKTSIVDCMKK